MKLRAFCAVLAALCIFATARAQVSTANTGLSVNTGALIVQGIWGLQLGQQNNLTTQINGIFSATAAKIISSAAGIATLTSFVNGAPAGTGASGSIGYPTSLGSMGISWSYAVDSNGNLVLVFTVSFLGKTVPVTMTTSLKAALINGNAPAANYPVQSMANGSSGGTSGIWYTIYVWNETGSWDGTTYTVTAGYQRFSYYVPTSGPTIPTPVKNER